jgi:hypothetical protein
VTGAGGLLGGLFAATGVAPSRDGVAYDPARMSRSVRYAATMVSAIAVAFIISACGTNSIQIPRSDPTYSADLAAAHLFNQRCGGCHTLSYAGTHGSGQNPRTYLAISGPNFNERCERTGGALRVLYAIENGGFSGAYMPANVVVGKQAREVANFVARFGGRQAAPQPGITSCIKKPLTLLPLTGAIPGLSGSSGS